MNKILALKIQDDDNVATIFSQEAVPQAVVDVRDRQGNITKIQIREQIPYGHKVAVRDIRASEPIRKYGEVIGAAARDIACGEYVHVHNMDSLRGRGDLETAENLR